MPEPRVLVIDDGLAYAEVVEHHLPEVTLVRPHGHGCLSDGPAALAYLEKHAGEVDVVLLDVSFDIDEERLLPLTGTKSARRIRRFQGVAILRAIRERWPEIPVVLLTAREDISLVDADGVLASQSMTYFLDTDDLDTLRIRIHGALRERDLDVDDRELLWGADRTVQQLRRRLLVLAKGAMPIILEGETGTGKSYLAERFVHRNSDRAGPFVVLDLATIPTDLIPAHLFGALKGSYTGAVADRKGVFELAHGGTLFIDEIQNVPLEVQKQLLNVLQERRVRPLGAAAELAVDVKVIAASNQPLQRAVSEGRFREDLYMRLGPATRVLLPPLRERRADLQHLATRLFERAAADPDNRRLGAQVAEAAGLSAEAPLALVIGARKSVPDGTLALICPKPAWQQLMDHPWPGNLRELQSVVDNVLSFTLVEAVDALRSGVPMASTRLQIDPGLVGELLRASAPLGQVPVPADGESIRVSLAPQHSLNAVATSVERQYFRRLFDTTGGDFEEMADRLLGDRRKARAVRLRLNQLGLKVRELKRA